MKRSDGAEALNDAGDEGRSRGRRVSAEPEPVWSDADAAALRELDALMCQTYQLWDHEWVGFSWRNYTCDHVRRVSNLALSLAAESGADRRVLAFAAVLHDITKSYDGEIEMRDGQRVVDEHGFWRNAYLPPSRDNAVTRLYADLNLAGTLHNVSGARVGDALLAERGYPDAFREQVGEIIVAHLKVTEAASLEGRCLYDADTIDANMGLPALYRNIQISMHRLEQQCAERGASLDASLAERERDLVREYVCERWPAWVGGKHRDFVERLTTEAGCRRALARVERLEELLAVMRGELDDYDAAGTTGYLAPILYFMRHRRNPSLSAEMNALELHWPCASNHPAARFLDLLRCECDGEL